MSTSTAPAARARWIGLLLGVLLLGAVTVFAVVLPALDDTEGGAEGSAEGGGEGSAAPALPTTLPGGWTAVDVVPEDPEDPAQAQQVAEQQKQATEYANGVLGDVYETAPPTLRGYTTAEYDKFVTVTVFEAPGGAFAPDGVPDPEQQGLARASRELVRVGEDVCILSYQPVPANEPVDDTAPPLGLTCQRSEGDRTVQLGGSGVTVEEATDLLDGLVADLG